MAWTTPLTAVANAALTAAQWNASVRDNFAETAAGKATTSGSLFAGTGVNGIAERVPAGTSVGTTETTASTSYTALATAGPAITVTTGVRAFVFFSAQLTTNTATLGAFMSYAVSGATAVASTDASALVHYPSSANLPLQATRVVMQGLTSGSNTFTAQYHVAGATTGSWSQRNISVLPL